MNSDMKENQPRACATRPALTQDDKCRVFLRATIGFSDRYKDEISKGMSDEDLEKALKSVLGIAGGSGSRGSLHVEYQGAGLKVWGGWHIISTFVDKPLFQGSATIAMARELYGISDPQANQLHLF